MSKIKKLSKLASIQFSRETDLTELFSLVAYPIRSTKTGIKINETRAVEALKKHIVELKQVPASEALATNAVLAVANAALIQTLVDEYLFEEFQDTSELAVHPPQAVVFRVLAFEAKHLALNSLIADLFEQLHDAGPRLIVMAASAEKVSNQLLSSLGELLLELLMVESGPFNTRNYGPVLEVLGMACKVSGQICSENKPSESSALICQQLGLQ